MATRSFPTADKCYITIGRFVPDKEADHAGIQNRREYPYLQLHSDQYRQCHLVRAVQPFRRSHWRSPGNSFQLRWCRKPRPGANLTCSRTYTITAADVTAGSVTNIASATSADAPSGGNTVTSNPSSVTVYAVVAPTIGKVFSPNSIPVGTTSLLTFMIANPSTNAVALSGVGFTDNFPSGVTIATAPDAAQCGGAVSSTATSITLTGGTILQTVPVQSASA